VKTTGIAEEEGTVAAWDGVLATNKATRPKNPARSRAWSEEPESVIEKLLSGIIPKQHN
jgi:hypothetical protein